MAVRRAWLGLGGNIGDVPASMRSALQGLDAQERLAFVRASSLYRTPPWGMSDQPDFLNACAEFETRLEPAELLAACLAAEAALHRSREGERWGPRTIDIDILAMEGIGYDSDGLTIPHPRLKDRAFALAPFVEIAPGQIVSGRSVEEWLDRSDMTGIERVAGPEEWLGDSGLMP